MEESDHTENDEDEEDEDEVFTVELNRGPHGLGMALVDGLVRITHSPNYSLTHPDHSLTHPLTCTLHSLTD